MIVVSQKCQTLQTTKNKALLDEVGVLELHQLCANRLLMRSCDVSVCDFFLQAREEYFIHCLLLSSQSDTGLPTVCIYRTEGIFSPSTLSSLPSFDKPLHSPVPFPFSGSFLFLFPDIATSVSLSSALLSYVPCLFSDICAVGHRAVFLN